MSKPSLVIVGAGGHAKVVAELACLHFWQIACFVDTVNLDRAGTVFHGAPVLNEMPNASQNRFSFAAVVAIGDCEARVKWVIQLLEAGWELPTLIHPSAVVSPSSQIGNGTVIMANAVVNASAILGKGVLVNTGAIVEHDSEVADGVHLAPRACLCGHVTVGAKTMVGAGSVVRDRVRIGSCVQLGAGSVVVKDVPDGVCAWGVPARIARS